MLPAFVSPFLLQKIRRSMSTYNVVFAEMPSGTLNVSAMSLKFIKEKAEVKKFHIKGLSNDIETG